MFNSIYSELIKRGMQPEKIKETIIETFDEFFYNKENLENHAINSLLPELVNYFKLKDHPKFYKGFSDLLEILNLAKNEDKHIAIRAIEDCFENIEIAHNKYWTIYSLDRKRLDMSLDEFTKFTFDQIKDLIEIMIKPYCLYIVNNIYIIDGKENEIPTIKKMNLGKLVGEIIFSNYLKNIFKLQVYTISGVKEIRINTLRNIAAHNDYLVINNKITCYIRDRNNKVVSELELKREELQKILVDVFGVFRALKLAYSIFIIDNLKELSNINTTNLHIRKEQLKLNLFFGIQSQGFEIIEFIDSNEKSVLILKELLKTPESIERAIHSSQFLYYLWEITRANKNEIEYRDKNNMPVSSFIINGEFCEKIEDGTSQASDIASEMKIINFKDYIDL